MMEKAVSEGIPNDGVMIDVQNVFKRFPVGEKEVDVLKGISFQVRHGEFLSVIGPSGNGKSTLLNMITGIDRPSEGEIVVANHGLNQMSEDSLAAWRGEHVGIIFQFFQMLPAISLLDNVILPMDLAGKYSHAERRERAAHLLERVDMADQRHKLPSQVSGGQQQRAAIARALANDPALLVADEPTGNLDSRTANEVFDLFQQVVDQGKTMLLVTHDKNIARRIPRTVEIVDGQIARDGAASALSVAG
jgi:putative ABC transport system ATP-binding protein